MLNSLIKHSFGAILLAVVVEELGIPLPIPTDFMIIFAGTAAGHSLPRLGLFYVTLTLASALGASGLYAVVRRGGRPLVDRFGRYVHLGPEQLSRAEALLSRSGWGGIALGRATPGLRYATVIVCGLLKVPYLRFITAHLVGSSVYIAAFLALGSIFGPAILDRIHLPVLAVRLLWVAPLAIGPPLLVAWGSSRFGRPAVQSRGRVVGAALLGGFAGAVSLAATLAATTAIAELLGSSHPLNVGYAFLGRLVGAGPHAHAISLSLYSTLLLLLVGMSAAYSGLVLPYLAPRGVSRLWQVLGLVLLVLGVFGLFLATATLVRHDDLPDLWWRTGGLTALLGVACGVPLYALTVVNSRALAVAVAHRSRSNRGSAF